jgi:hypothetical protein
MLLGWLVFLDKRRNEMKRRRWRGNSRKWTTCVVERGSKDRLGWSCARARERERRGVKEEMRIDLGWNGNWN